MASLQFLGDEAVLSSAINVLFVVCLDRRRNLEDPGRTHAATTASKQECDQRSRLCEAALLCTKLKPDKRQGAAHLSHRCLISILAPAASGLIWDAPNGTPLFVLLSGSEGCVCTSAAARKHEPNGV